MFVLTAYLIFLSGLGTLLMAINYPRYPSYYLKWGGAWCVFAAVAGLISIPAILMLSVLLYMNKFVQNEPAEKASTYLATFASMPIDMVWSVPGPPGINIILDLSVNLMIMICLFGPTLYRHFASGRNRLITDKYDRVFVYYVGIMLILGFIRSPTVTGGLRYVVATVLLFGLLYCFISRYLSRPKQIHLCLTGLVFGAVIVSCMAMLEQAKFWYLFPEIEWAMGMTAEYGMSYLVRAGLLRAQVTTGHPIALGVYMVIAITGVTYLWDTHQRKTLLSHASFLCLITVLTLGIINSGSKTAYLGLGVAIAMYSYLRVKRGYTRTASKWAIILISLFIAFGPDLDNLSEGQVGTETETILSDSGSFSYRALLMRTSLMVMLKNPFFGTADFFADPDMEVLRQGAGIIDITNFYLVVGLSMGYVGLFLFLIMWVKPQIELMMLLRRANHTFPHHLRALGASLTAGSFSLAVMMTTVSGMGVIPFLMYAFIALLVAYLRNIRHWALEEQTKPTTINREVSQIRLPGFSTAPGYLTKK